MLHGRLLVVRINQQWDKVVKLNRVLTALFFGVVHMKARFCKVILGVLSGREDRGLRWD
jgi:hypothetical protein